MNTKQLFLIAAGALAAGTLFAEETKKSSDQGAKNSITITMPEVPKIDVKISAFSQVQYVTSHSSGSNAGSKSGFQIRRANIGASAKLDDNWNAVVSYEFDSKDSGGSVGSGYIDKALIQYKNDSGTLQVGCRKINFMVEEYGSCLKAQCLENSIATNYIVGDSGPVGLAGRHLGIFWDGEAENFSYGASFTNAVANDYDKRSNNYAFNANAGYTIDLEDDSKVFAGVNTTFNFGDEGGTSTSPKTNDAYTYGIEPYVKFTGEGFTGLLDLFYVDGDKLSRTFGANATLSYKLDNGVEPVVRLSYLNTHSEEVNASIVKNFSESGNYSCATGYYVGANYYLNKYIKVSAGYEYLHMFGDGNGDSNGLRMQIQAAF